MEIGDTNRYSRLMVTVGRDLECRTACQRTFYDPNVSSSTSYSHTDTVSDFEEITNSEAEDERYKVGNDKSSSMDRQLIEAKHISDDNSDKNRKIPLYIGGLFELTGPRGSVLGYSELTAARLAVDHVNMDNVIPGYTLTLLHNDTAVSVTLFVLEYSKSRLKRS
ncbi:hypothetical protein CHS0354_039994 [Potamilus streckersoni]|uniref:Receptor ligand binding region domain-containing protein n=1 Tax=Potamilus streckersoni TaxID=2493646 RepID=A0AAE0RZX3_9BIVA|nr:hypothetical protein CHS0354_039994 [Potamilus streckersoni]